MPELVSELAAQLVLTGVAAAVCVPRPGEIDPGADREVPLRTGAAVAFGGTLAGESTAEGRVSDAAFGMAGLAALDVALVAVAPVLAAPGALGAVGGGVLPDTVAVIE
jgi:hypothetical protein